MNFKLELPEGMCLLNKKDLKELLQDLLFEIQNESDNVMTVNEVAEYLKVSIPTVRKMITNKEIPYFKNGQIIRFKRSDINEWLRNNSQIRIKQG